jgi:glycosyltransferase involved in cell wall biosynthesis
VGPGSRPGRVLPSGRLRILVDYRPALRQRTGVGEYAHQLAAALARRVDDVEVTLFSSSWKDRLPPDPIPGAATVDARVPVKVLNFAWHRLRWPPVETLGATEPDIAWSLHPLILPSLGAAQVVTVHDLYFLDAPHATEREVRRDYPRLAARHARGADGVIVNSEYTRSLVEERLNVPGDRITVCYPGAPAWRVRAEPASAGPILHVGTIEPRKNVETLIKGYIRLFQQRPDAPPLVFAGRIGTPVDALLRPHGGGPWRQRIQFLGYVSDEERLRLYREASMLLIASWDEGFGVPALEAMTIGLPVIAAARGALPDALGGAGILVNPGDSEEMAGAMARLRDDPALRREQAAKGVKRARDFDWDASASRLIEAFEHAMARKAARS